MIFFLKWVSDLFYLITKFRSYFFSLFRPYKSKFIVVSVGNITVGGTGKTPFVDLLCKNLSSKKVAILSRGYGRKFKGFFKVDIQNPQAPRYYGDEPVMLAEKNPQALVFVCENREQGLKNLEKNYPDIEIVILDDALQNYSIHKDLEYVILDATEDYLNYQMLPLGRARVCMSSVSESAIIVFTKIDLASPDARLESFFSNNRKIYLRYSRPNLDETILNKKDGITLVSGIGKPKNFEKVVSQFVKVKKHYIFKDHHNYKVSDFKFIEKNKDEIILTTEKDFVKIQRLHLEFSVQTLPIQFEVVSGNEFLSLIEPQSTSES